MLQLFERFELQFQEAQSALEAARDAPSKAKRQADLEVIARERSDLRVQLAVNRLNTDAFHAPPNVRKRIDELAKQMTDPKARSAAEFAADLAARLRDAKTIHTVCNLLVAAEHRDRVGDFDRRVVDEHGVRFLYQRVGWDQRPSGRAGPPRFCTRFMQWWAGVATLLVPPYNVLSKANRAAPRAPMCCG